MRETRGMINRIKGQEAREQEAREQEAREQKIKERKEYLENTQMITRGRKRKVEEHGVPPASEVEPSLAKKRRRAAQVQREREGSAEIDEARMTGTSEKASLKVPDDSKLFELQRPLGAESSTEILGSGGMLPGVPSIEITKPINVPTEAPKQNSLEVAGSASFTSARSKKFARMGLTLPSKGGDQTKQLSPRSSEAVDTPMKGVEHQTPNVIRDKTPEMEPIDNIREKGVKACYRYEELQSLVDISKGLEEYANKKEFTDKEGYISPSELGTFRNDFIKFDENIRRFEEAIGSGEKNKEALLAIHREIVESQRQLDASREKFRTGWLVEHMDMNWVDDEGQLAVGASIEERKAPSMDNTVSDNTTSSEHFDGGNLEEAYCQALRFAGASFAVDVRKGDYPSKAMRAALQKYNIKLLCFPMVDQRGATKESALHLIGENENIDKIDEIDALEMIADEINKRREKGQIGVVKCREGQGRSVTVAVAAERARGKKDARSSVSERRLNSKITSEQTIQLVVFDQRLERGGLSKDHGSHPFQEATTGDL